MKTELVDKVNEVFALDKAENNTQVDVALLYTQSNVIVASVKKIADGHYSLGYSAIGRVFSDEKKIGSNCFKGDVRTLFLGLINSMTRSKAVNQCYEMRHAVAKMIDYLKTIVEPLPEDETKVKVDKWTIPTMFIKI